MIDVASFQKLNVADTCSLWNLLSSPTLSRAAYGAGCQFCITGYVWFECLIKPRTNLDDNQMELRRRLQVAESSKQIGVHSISLDDLLDVEILESRRKLGKGELTSIVFAKRTNQAALSDDKGARKLAAEILGSARSQWTPQLLGWLFYTDRLGDHDCRNVSLELASLGRSLSPHLENGYHSALQAKLLDSRP